MKITFYRASVNADGVPYNAHLLSVEFPASLPKEEAMRRAKEQFQTQMGIARWQDIAHTCEAS